ncbi:MAG: hypothetical protein ACPG46_01055 [Thalassotalea sp.]
MKIIASLLVVVLMVLGGGLWFLANGSLNDFVKTQIESVGSSITEQKVGVNAVDIRLTEGAGTLKGLKIANPRGYSQENAFTLDETTLDIDLASLTKEPIVVDAVIIKAPQAFVQIKANGSSNIQDLLDAINKNTASATPPPEKTPSTSPEPKLSVSKIVLAGTQLTLDLTDLGNKVHQVTLPDINLNNIGGTNGLPASELGAVIAKEALSSIWAAAKKQQKEALKEKAKEKLEDKAKKELGKLFGK